ncbi:MAG: hypothetical protein QM770_08735 [Tepidisphaeraceae bacterium]
MERLARVERGTHRSPGLADRPYKVYLKSPDAVRGRIDYVERNPLKEGLPPQRYVFVSAFR